MTIWFWSDQHFFHENVIRYSNRPFRSVEEMNDILIENHNSVVQDGDTVVYGGDLSFGSGRDTSNLLRRLKGKKIWVPGNHDSKLVNNDDVLSFFNLVTPYHEIKLPPKPGEKHGQLIVVCHYPMIQWNRGHHGSYMLHGHCHGSCEYPSVKSDLGPGRIMDIGVDPLGYFPWSFEKIDEVLSKRPFFKHHDR